MIIHRMKTYLPLFAFVLLLLSACSKNDDSSANTTTPQPSKKELLTANSWKYKSWTVTPGLQDSLGNTFTDYYAYLPQCEKDDIITFATNGGVTIDEGASKCDANDPQEQIGTWSFLNNETKLNMNGYTYSIATLTSTELVLTFTDLQGSTTVNHTVTLRH